ncbi:MAG TPA: PQQ-binding-like beta-propeller repeat protein [Burkholderiaceae bacterium]|nr:PQQ-binding-like beta-propeller repeat protein [Burkholderiaceae bacterium]
MALGFEPQTSVGSIFPTPLVGGGVIYVGSADGRLDALECGSAPPGTGAWQARRRCLDCEPMNRARFIATSIALAAACVAALPARADDNEDLGELMGDLVFHADLMTSLDTLCPGASPRRDWLSVLPRLPADVRTVELRAMSRRLSADAAQAMVRGSGGCRSPHFAQAYAQTRNEYESLLEQWAQLSV